MIFTRERPKDEQATVIPPLAPKPSRVKLQVPQVAPEYAAFAAQCSKVLGYVTLERSIVKPLAEVLLKLDIEILDGEEVMRYMKSAKEHVRGEGLSMERTPLRRGCPDEYWEWRTYDLEMYRKEVPEFVLRKALQIKTALPEVNLFVHELAYFHDPFLSAHFQGEHYYVEVWDEAKFEGRMPQRED